MKKYRPRTYYTEPDKTMMWDRWRQGGFSGHKYLFDINMKIAAQDAGFQLDNIQHGNCPDDFLTAHGVYR